MEKRTTNFIAECGDHVIADALGVEIGRVRVWKHRNRIPREVWPELVQAFPDVTLEKLMELERAA